MAHLCFGLIFILLTNLQKLLSESYVFRSIYEIVYFKNMYINMLNLMCLIFRKNKKCKGHECNQLSISSNRNCNLIDIIIHIR